MKKYILIAFFLILLGFGIVSYTDYSRDTGPAPILSQIPSPKPESLNEWQSIDEKWFKMNYQTSINQQNYRISVFKAPLSQVKASLYYDKEPQALQSWKNILSEKIVLNGNYFDESYNPTGKFVLDGRLLGSSPYKSKAAATITFDDHKIEFYINQEAPDSNFSLQSYPVLLADGGVEQIAEDSEKIARRTVVGKTRNKELIIFLVDETPISLYSLMMLLKDEKFDVDLAVNLDGGQSSGLIYENNGQTEHILPIVALPIVIGVD